MKYRLVELLQCPDHPELFLRTRSAMVSEVFPYAGDLQMPVCRSGCGYLGNWFVDIPMSLPPHHRLDCRRCLGIEIEQAELSCPECPRIFTVTDGILHAGADQYPAGSSLPAGEKMQASAQIDKILGPKTGDIVLTFSILPDELQQKWCARGIEHIQVVIDTDSIQTCRARSCARGDGKLYYLRGPVDIGLLRHDKIDSVIISIPQHHTGESVEQLGALLNLIKQSGQALFIFKRDKSDRTQVDGRHEAILAGLPPVFRSCRTKLFDAHDHDLLFVEHPDPEQDPNHHFAVNGEHR